MIGVAEILFDLFSGSGDSETNDAIAPTAPEIKSITLEEVRAVLAKKSRDSLISDIRDLLKKYDADKLSEIDPIHYSALLVDAEVLSKRLLSASSSHRWLNCPLSARLAESYVDKGSDFAAERVELMSGEEVIEL